MGSHINPGVIGVIQADEIIEVLHFSAQFTDPRTDRLAASLYGPVMDALSIGLQGCDTAPLYAYK